MMVTHIILTTPATLVEIRFEPDKEQYNLFVDGVDMGVITPSKMAWRFHIRNVDVRESNRGVQGE